MADGLIQVPPDSTGKKVDQSELTVGANTVERQRIVIADDSGATALTAVSNTAPAQTGYAANTRNTPRKFGATLSTANLGISGVYTQAWQDSNAGGELLVTATARADQVSAASGFVIQESDDSSDANFTRTVSSATTSINTTAFLYGLIRARYWRIQYTNGATGQTSFKITGTASLANTFGDTQAPVRTDPTGTTAQPASQSGTWTVQPGNTANTTAWKVDGSAVTQPVSGTFWQATQPVSGTVTANQGGTWTVQPGNTANTTAWKVDGSAVTQPVSGTVTANQGTPTNWAANVAQINAVTPLMGNGVTGTGSQRVTVASDNTAFSVNAVQSGTWTVQPGNTANTTPWLVTDTPATSGGLAFTYILSAATNNKTAVKATAGQFFCLVATNTNAAVRYLKVFNATSANVTMGTTAADYQFPIPGNTAGAGVAINIDKGIAHSAAITVAITTGVSLTDNTSTAANEQSVLIGYK